MSHHRRRDLRSEARESSLALVALGLGAVLSRGRRPSQAGLNPAQLRVHYQPKIDVRTRRAVGAEALVRWQHPLRGLVGPAEFMDRVEQDARVLAALTRHVLEVAVRDCAHWCRDGRELSVAVNVSAAMLCDRRLVDTVEEVLRTHELEPRLLTLEITETAIMDGGATAAELLHELRRLGVRVSIDDFGTGHSSLARLRTFPVDELKLDGCFVRQMTLDERDRALVRLVVEISAVLGLTVVAEGVEDPPTLELLAEIGCPVAQGYLFARPLPGSQLLAQVDRGFSGDFMSA